MKFPVFVLFLITSNGLLAQTGPGGVGNSTTNNIWYSGDFGTFSDAGTTPATQGQRVQQWNDRSGNSRHASQATPANRPLYDNSAANGYAGLRFTRNLFIDGPAPGIASNSSYTYIIVFRDTATSLGGTNDGNGEFILDRTSGTNALVSLKPVTGSRYFYQKRRDNGGGLGGVTGTTAINTNTKIIMMRRSYNVNYQLYYNNAQEGGNLADSDGATTPPAPRIGRHATTTNGGLRGYINEFIVYNTALNLAQRIIINNYLSAKYGLSLAANDLYTMDNTANGDYDHEVAGIGRISAGNLNDDAQGTGVVRMNSPSALGDNDFLIWGHDGESLNINNVVDVDGTSIESRIGRVWRLSEVGSVGTVTLSFDVSSFSPLVGSDLRLLIDRDGDGFSDNDVTPQTGSFAAGTVTFTGVDFQNGDRFTLGSIDSAQTPLPIELIDFHAKPIENRKVKLEWQTASEFNNDFFTVERFKKDFNWEVVATVEGAGDASRKSNYSVVDEDPYTGLSYYRLKQVDFDGSFQYSTIKSVEIDELGEESIRIYPNPSSNEIQVSGSQSELSDVRIFNALGQDISSATKMQLINESSNGLLKVDISSLTNGLYYLKTKSSARMLHKR